MSHRKFTENRLVIASHNKGKVEELAELLNPYNLTITSSSDFKLDEPVEDGNSFIENAEIKARYTAQKTELPSLADDSGIVIPALDGQPGIYSARWGGPEKNFYKAMQKVEDLLIKKTGSNKGHDANFVCALSICWPEGESSSCEGKVYGKLTFPPRGERGFGYDPIFIPNGYNITFAEMELTEKSKIDHRANAFHKFASKFLGKNAA